MDEQSKQLNKEKTDLRKKIIANYPHKFTEKFLTIFNNYRATKKHTLHKENISENTNFIVEDFKKNVEESGKLESNATIYRQVEMIWNNIMS